MIREIIYEQNGLPKLIPWDSTDEHYSFMGPDKNNRNMGALATHAYRQGLSLKEAAQEFEKITKQDLNNAGCPCCGPPHHFTEYDENGIWINSGPNYITSCDWGG